MDKVCRILNNAKCLNTSELERVSAALLKMLGRTKGVHGVSAQRAEKCRKCGVTHIVKFGKDKNGKQLYKCKSCGITFTDTSYSALSHTRHAEDIWETFIYLTLKGASLEECAFQCDISVRTAFVYGALPLFISSRLVHPSEEIQRSKSMSRMMDGRVMLLSCKQRSWYRRMCGVILSEYGLALRISFC